MQVLDVYFKDVHAVVEHRREDLEKLRLFLDNCKIELSQDASQELKAASAYVCEKFFPDLEALIKNLQNEGG